MTDLHRSRIVAWSLTAIGVLGIVALLAAERDTEAVVALPGAVCFGAASFFIDRDLPLRRGWLPAMVLRVPVTLAAIVVVSLMFDSSAPVVWIVLGMGLAEFARLRRFSAPNAY